MAALGHPHPIATPSHHHCWPSCNLCSPPCPSFEPSLVSIQREPSRLPRISIAPGQDASVPSPSPLWNTTRQQERGAAVKFCSERSCGRLFCVFSFLFPNLGSLHFSHLAHGHQETRGWAGRFRSQWAPTAERIPDAQDNGLFRPQKAAQCCTVCT